jgi:hypothetical protein
MTGRISLIITVVGAALTVAIPTAWSAERQGPGNLAVSPEVFELTSSGDDTYAGRIGPGTLAVSPVVFEQTVLGREDEPSNALASSIGPTVIHDHGDATQAKLLVQSPPMNVIHDHGDATQAKVEARLLLQSPATEVIRDHGDATQAKLVGTDQAAWAPFRATFDKYVTQKQGPSEVVGNPSPITPTTSGRDIQWPELGIGFGVGMLVLLGLILTVRFGRSHPVAH